MSYNTDLQSINTDLQSILDSINALPEAGSGGVDTSDATATAEDILAGETAYVNDVKITGTMTNNGSISQTMDGIDTKSVTIPSGYTSGGTVSLDDTIDTEVDTQADLISQIATALEGKAAGGSGGAGVETCNIELSFTDFSLVQGAQYCTVNEGILNFVGDYFEDQQGHVLGGVACGSIVVVYAFAMDSSYVGDGDCTYLYGDNNMLIMIAPERSGDYAATIYGA